MRAARQPRRDPHEASVLSATALSPLGVRAPVEVEPFGLVRSARLTLRPLGETDRAEFLRVTSLSREHLRRCSELHHPGEDDDAMFSRQLRLTREGDAHGTAWRRGGFLADGRLAGCFNVNTITRGLSWEGHLNWWVSAEEAGKGLGTEGLLAMIDFCAADLPRGLGLHMLRAGVMECNEVSLKQVRRAGFVASGERTRLAVGGRWELHEMFERRSAQE